MSGNPTLITYDDTLGALLIGALLSMTLWGITCVLMYDYFMDSDNQDGLLQRLVVALLWVTETIASALDSHIVYHFLITNYANPSALVKPTWSINCHSLPPSITNLIVRTMFARSIYTFGQRSVVVPIWIMCISICDFVVSITGAVAAFYEVGVTPFLSRLVYLTFAFGVTADLSVAVSLCWLLQSAKSGFRRSDSLVNTLMTYVVSTGVLVTIVATVTLITFIALPHNFVYFTFLMVLSKLYLNSYLASLNGRIRLRAKNFDSTIRLSHRGLSLSRGTNTQSDSFHNQAMAITWNTTIERKVDGVETEEPASHAV